jgi:hypothetical protein
LASPDFLHTLHALVGSMAAQPLRCGAAAECWGVSLYNELHSQLAAHSTPERLRATEQALLQDK